MKYFLPDSQDLVDPDFDFIAERHRPGRLRERDDRHAHEILGRRAYDGLLVSKAIVDGAGGPARYTRARRGRLLDEGVRGLFRLGGCAWGSIECMGDCGAFSYVRADEPPYSVDEVIDFYERCGFDHGVCVDHIVREYDPAWEGLIELAPPEVRARQQLTLELARDFWTLHSRGHLRWAAIGVAHGWGPRSYARAFGALQSIGYRTVALGGLAALRTADITTCLRRIAEVRRPGTRIHLLGVGRIEGLGEFAALGVASIDSTSPLRQAFMAERSNYHTSERAYSAIRVPQSDKSPKILSRVRAGELDESLARAREVACLQALMSFESGGRAVSRVLVALRDYSALHDPEVDRAEDYRATLEEAPWRRCPCEICRRLGVHVVVFRGAERNRSRGLHNVWTFYQRLRGLGLDGGGGA